MPSLFRRSLAVVAGLLLLIGSTTAHAAAPPLGVKSVSAAELERNVKVKASEVVKQSDIDADMAMIRDYVSYPSREARIVATPVFSSDKPGVTQAQPEVAEQKPARVGQIIIVGNERTRQDVILRQVPLYPGQILDYSALRQAEDNLARTGIFEVNAETGVRPTVTVIDNPSDPDAEFEDILVTVRETATGSLMFGLGVSSEGGLVGSIVLSERNFDAARWPTSLDDLCSGDAFRGAGVPVRLELVLGGGCFRALAACGDRVTYAYQQGWRLRWGSAKKSQGSGAAASMTSEPPAEVTDQCPR